MAFPSESSAVHPSRLAQGLKALYRAGSCEASRPCSVGASREKPSLPAHIDLAHRLLRDGAFDVANLHQLVRVD